MALPQPSFNDLLSHYPHAAGDVGAGGVIVNNPGYVARTCAVRLSIAIEGAIAGTLAGYTGGRAQHIQSVDGRRKRFALPYARSASELAQYLRGAHVGWPAIRLHSRAEASRLTSQGIIYWDVKAGSQYPNHIDLWDPAMRTLRTAGGRTMLWAPPESEVESVLYWELVRGGAYTPVSIPHPLQSG